MEVAVIPGQPERQDAVGLHAMKPYSGSPAKGALVVYDANGGPGHPHVNHSPAPAWADLGIVSHMEGAVVEKGAPKAGAEHLQPELQGANCCFRFVAVVLSIVETGLSYAAYFQARSPEDSLYNKFEAYMLGYPGLDSALLVFAVANTAVLFVFWAMIAIIRLDLYRQMASMRLALSLPSGGICIATVFFSEGEQATPFLCATTVLLHFIVYLCYEYWVRRERFGKCGKRLCFVFILLISCWTASFVMMFCVGVSDYLRETDCPATENIAMPVRIKGVHEWQCVKWEKPHYIRRQPVPGEAAYKGLCSTSFHVFDTVNTSVNASAGSMVSSRMAHLVSCPSHCQSLGLGAVVVGCGVYSATSSICSAAVQMGILPANQGGVVKVIGREPPPSGVYERCNRNGVASSDAPFVPAAAGSSAHDSSPGWAFYFQVDSTEKLDMIQLLGWKKTGAPGAKEPWRSFTADVQWVVGGTSHRQEVMLGPPDRVDPDVELNFCAGTVSCS